MNDNIFEDNKIRCKNIVSIYAIRMYLNGFIIGYVFRHQIYKKFYIHKNDNVIFHFIKRNIFSMTNDSISRNATYLTKYNSPNNKKRSLYNRLNINRGNGTSTGSDIRGGRSGNRGGVKNHGYLYKLIPFNELANLRRNIQVSNFVAFRLSFWTCFCTLTCWQLNRSLENSLVSPILSGFVASSLNILVFREQKKTLIPRWFGCLLSYVIFI
ncbi:shikimate dehydrogenase, putative [Plasmodium ovale]|uniref:Shikimate dehydrogenase, putative n=1 Tax=Plasmodium ovale TaxID=36330 RepID=A0A1C3KWE5_PLAOA|nr:shikimate dehydrogenase, putative [Plasmodium ovale]